MRLLVHKPLPGLVGRRNGGVTKDSGIVGGVKTAVNAVKRIFGSRL